MVYAMPGMVSQLNLQADRPTVLFGQSSHFSGDGFSDMQFQVRSVPPAEFAAWARKVHAAGPMLDQAAYVGLARQSQDVKPFTYRGVDPQLFQAISTQKIAPGPGPEPANPTHAGREVAAGGQDVEHSTGESR
jgi:cytochrome o ubiquinol oxidase subunit 2